MKLNDLTFDIGDWVVVSVEQQRILEGKKISWEPEVFKSPRVGRIVGLCRRSSGVRIDGGMYYDWDGTPDYESNYLEVTQSHIFYQVKFGWFNKPVLVAEKDMTLCPLEEIQELPLLSTQQYEWNPGDKDRLREDMKYWPRDSKGRWIKEYSK